MLAKLSLAFRCFSLFLLWFFIGFSAVLYWCFLDVFLDFSLVLNNFHALFFPYHCFCSLVFIGFSGVFFGVHVFRWFSFVFQRFFWFSSGFLYHSLMFL